jgi:hypothetical protein
MSNSIDKKDAVANTVTDDSGTAIHTQLSSERQISRRRFIRTLGAGAAGVALTACGGGGKVPVPKPKPAPTPAPAPGPAPAPAPSPAPPVSSNPPPAWTTVPAITFTEGVAATISIAGYVSDNNALTISKNAVALPAGVKFDVATKSFIYDGIGRVSATEGHVLTAVEV